MSFSLYYTAKREYPLTAQEQVAAQEITERYCAQYPFRRKAADFGIYDRKEQGDIIFSGATKLPGGRLQTLYDAANYWMKCLTELTGLLEGAVWSATFDDVDLIFDPEEDWRFPTDEEYKEQKLSRG